MVKYKNVEKEITLRIVESAKTYGLLGRDFLSSNLHVMKSTELYKSWKKRGSLRSVQMPKLKIRRL